MSKKLISALLAGAIFIGTSSVAMAEQVNQGGGTADMEATGEITPAIIDVEIPTNLEFSIDPFNVSKGGKVNTAALTIENKSNVPVEIKMTALKGEVGVDSDINLVESPAKVTEEGNGKDAFLWVGPVAVTFDKTNPDTITSVKPGAAYSESKNVNQVVTTTEGTEVISMGNLLEATYDEGTYKETNAKGKMHLGIMGDVRSAGEWAEADSVTVTATFSVDPKVVGTVK